MSIIDNQTQTPATDSTDEQPIAEGNSQVTEDSQTTKTVEQTEVTEGNEDSFFDPNQVPEELKPAYKQMQAAFTKKTQEIAETRKASEEFKTQAEEYAKYKQYIPVIEEMLQGRQSAQQTPELTVLETQLKQAGYSDDAIEMMKISAGFLLKQVNQERQAEGRQNWLSNQITEAAKVDPRLTDSNLVYQTDEGEQVTFGGLVEQLVMSDRNWQNDPIASTRRAVKQVDALIGSAKKEGKEELSASAKVKAGKFPKDSSSPQSATATDRLMSVQEAAAEAKKELGI